LVGETEVLGENLPQGQFVYHKSHMTRPGFEPGPPRWEGSDYFFLILVCEAIGTAATPGLLCQPRVIVKMTVKQMECRLAVETEVLGENLPQVHFVYHKPHMTRPGFEPGPPRWETSD
jgi:hypothetical protein